MFHIFSSLKLLYALYNKRKLKKGRLKLQRSKVNDILYFFYYLPYKLFFGDFLQSFKSSKYIIHWVIKWNFVSGLTEYQNFKVYSKTIGPKRRKAAPVKCAAIHSYRQIHLSTFISFKHQKKGVCKFV